MAIAADIQQQVYDLLAHASNISLVAAEKETLGRLPLSPGQRISAEVVGMLPNNRTQVRIGGERFNLDLPMTVRLGQTLEMTFVSEDPRSTFAIARQGGVSPPVSLSDASRLVSLLISSEQIADPGLRSSLQSIGDMLRRSSGETGVLANLLDEVLTYGTLRGGVKATPRAPDDSMHGAGDGHGAPLQQGSGKPSAEQARLAAFESSAARILSTIARDARFILTEAVNQPLTPLPLLPGEEVNGTVLGTLPGGRAFVQVAGITLELPLPRAVQAGEILRLTYLSSQPKPTFALSRSQSELSPALLSEAGRWLSVLEHSGGGLSSQQAYVLERLNTVLKSLPPDSAAFTAIRDEALTYDAVMRSRPPADQTAALAGVGTPPLPGNGIVMQDDMARLLQAVIRGNRLALLEALNQQGLPAAFTAGQQLKGEVLAALGGGRFMVQVASQNLEFSLPKGIRRGDRLNLFFITGEPQLTFLMVRFGRGADARISDTGRWLSGFLGDAQSAVPAGATMGLLSALLSGPPDDAVQVGQLLQQGLRSSGLFYESHLARWFGGEYPLADLLKEPQGRLSPRLQQGEPHQAAPADELARASLRTGSAEIMEAVFQKVGRSMSHEGLADQRSLPIVSEQMSALQSGQLLIRGDLFPGQQLQWSVREREAHRNQTGEQQRSWDTDLTVNLPRLGAVSLHLGLDGSQVRLDLRADAAETALLLEGERPRLIEQLQAAGLTATQIGIRYAARP